MILVAVTALALLAGDPGDPDAIARLLTPTLRAALHPLPELVDTTKAARLAWMATLGRRVNRARHLSDSAAWRAIMGWPSAEDAMSLTGWSPEALDQSADRYPVPRGKTDPATDFAASVALAWLDPHNFACDFPLRARFLQAHDLAPARSPRCPAFEAWAEPDEVVAVDVIFVAQRWVDIAATMGHVIFRVRQRDRGVIAGPSFARTFSYVAKDATDTPGYLLKGLTGGLTAGVQLERFGDVVARYGLSEGRDMYVYELVLDDDERRALLAEVFAQSRGNMQIPYAFFSTNCATMAWNTLRSVVPELPALSGTLVHPHEVVSLLLAAGRARPYERIAARKSLAIAAERRSERGPPATSRPEVLASYASRWRPAAERAEALRALADALEKSPIDATQARDEARAVARYLDGVLDIESFAVDQGLGKVDALATSPAFDAALAARATLPIAESGAGVVPLPEAPIGRSGSRRMQLGGGWDGRRALLGWSAAVLDEESGEARVIGLRRASRMRLLDNALVLSSDGRDVAIEEERLTLIASATWGTGVRTDQGWLPSHLGFGFALETWSRPRDAMPFAIRLGGGPGLTLLASDDFASHIVAALDLGVASWSGPEVGGANFRASAGLAVEAALAMGTPLVRWLARGRVAPALDLAGAALEVQAQLALDLAIVPADAIFLRIIGTYATGLPAGDGWSVGAAVSF